MPFYVNDQPIKLNNNDFDNVNTLLNLVADCDLFTLCENPENKKIGLLKLTSSDESFLYPPPNAPSLPHEMIDTFEKTYSVIDVKDSDKHQKPLYCGMQVVNDCIATLIMLRDKNKQHYEKIILVHIDNNELAQNALAGLIEKEFGNRKLDLDVLLLGGGGITSVKNTTEIAINNIKKTFSTLYRFCDDKKKKIKINILAASLNWRAQTKRLTLMHCRTDKKFAANTKNITQSDKVITAQMGTFSIFIKFSQGKFSLLRFPRSAIFSGLENATETKKTIKLLAQLTYENAKKLTLAYEKKDRKKTLNFKKTTQRLPQEEMNNYFLKRSNQKNLRKSEGIIKNFLSGYNVCACNLTSIHYLFDEHVFEPLVLDTNLQLNALCYLDSAYKQFGYALWQSKAYQIGILGINSISQTESFVNIFNSHVKTQRHNSKLIKTILNKHYIKENYRTLTNHTVTDCDGAILNNFNIFIRVAYHIFLQHKDTPKIYLQVNDLIPRSWGKLNYALDLKFNTFCLNQISLGEFDETLFYNFVKNNMRSILFDYCQERNIDDPGKLIHMLKKLFDANEKINIYFTLFEFFICTDLLDSVKKYKEINQKNLAILLESILYNKITEEYFSEDQVKIEKKKKNYLLNNFKSFLGQETFPSLRHLQKYIFEENHSNLNLHLIKKPIAIIKLQLSSWCEENDIFIEARYIAEYMKLFNLLLDDIPQEVFMTLFEPDKLKHNNKRFLTVNKILMQLNIYLYDEENQYDLDYLKTKIYKIISPWLIHQEYPSKGKIIDFNNEYDHIKKFLLNISTSSYSSITDSLNESARYDISVEESSDDIPSNKDKKTRHKHDKSLLTKKQKPVKTKLKQAKKKKQTIEEEQTKSDETKSINHKSNLQ